MGGLRAIGGFHGQAEYAALQIASRLADPTFGGVWLESTDDVTFWREPDNHVEYERHQVKNHNVAPAEFRDAVESLHRPVGELGRIPDHAVLAATNFSPELESLKADFERVQNARTAPQEVTQGVLVTTELELEKKLKRLLGDRNDLITFSSRSLALRSAQALKLDEHEKEGVFATRIKQTLLGRDLPTEVAAKLFRPLVHFLDDSAGKPLPVAEIEREIVRLTAGLGRSGVSHQELAIGCWESPLPSAQYRLDWTRYFDRGNPRRLPTLPEWDMLRGQLGAIKERIVNAGGDRHLIISGKMSLTTALLAGHTFPRNAAFMLRMQPTVGSGPWDTGTAPDNAWGWVRSEVPAESADGLLCLIIGVNQIPTQAVIEYCRSRPEAFGGAVVLTPAGGPSDRAILTSAQATAASSAAMGVIRQMHQAAPERAINLFYVGPAPLALLLGQLLHSVGGIYLYEYDGTTYKQGPFVT